MALLRLERKLCKLCSCHIACIWSWDEQNRGTVNTGSCCAADLMNEMRSACNTAQPNVSCTATATQYMQAWVEEIAAYVKTVDPNHLLTVGEEGFYAVSPCLPHGVPGAPAPPQHCVKTSLVSPVSNWLCSGKSFEHSCM